MAGENQPIEQSSETNEDLFDAISHGIDNEGALPEDPPASDEGDGSGDGVGTGEQPTEGDGEGTDVAPADDTSDEEADAAGYARDPVTGKFVKKEEVAAAIDPKTGKAVEPKKAPDAINDPIPKDLKAETQTRIRSLIDTAKRATAESERVRGEFETLVSGIQGTRTTPEQFGEVMSFMALFNSNDPAQQEKALEQVEILADRLATMLGKERTITDPLAAHNDLQAAVKSGALTQQYAKEIARTRNAQGFRGHIQQQHQAQQLQTQAFEQAQGQARTELNTLGGQLEQRDGKDVFDAKRAALVPILQPMFKGMHPSQWREAFLQAYENYKYVAPAVAAPVVPKNPAKQHPMRAGKGTVGSGGVAKQSGSALDAVNAALSSFGG